MVGLSTTALTVMTLLGSPTLATVAQTPLIVGQTVAPNIFFVFDDSGSMQWEFMPPNAITNKNLGGDVDYPAYYLYPAIPDDVYDSSLYNDLGFPTFEDDIVNAYMRFSGTNKIYYNPAMTYTRWAKPYGTPMNPADKTGADWNPGNDNEDPYDLTEQKTVSAFWVNEGTHNQEPIDVDCDPGHDDDSCEAYQQSFWPMVYWVYEGTEADLAAALADDNDDSEWDVRNYTKVEFRGSNGIAITKPQDNDPTNTVDVGYIVTNATMAHVRAIPGYPDNAPQRSYEEAQQNFANWFTYYRSRNLLAKAGVGRAFSEQGESVRVGFGAISRLDTKGKLNLGVVYFSNPGRQTFFDTFYQFDNDRNGTPLRDALNELGQHLEEDKAPWRTDPNDSESDMKACRQNYAILMTDGYWNGEDPDGIGDEDGDGEAETLADVAMYFWANDLRSDLDNTVATSPGDTANWQHMVTFTVGLGVFGTLSEQERATAISDPGNFGWPDPDDGDKEKIDDLFHAAVNGHGQYFSAANPEQFAQALIDALKTISKRGGAAASATTNTGLATQGKAGVYRPRYQLHESGEWTGDLLALSFTVGDGLSDPTAFAADQLDSQNWNTGREVVTYNGSSHQGAAFRWNNISASHQAELDVNPQQPNSSDGLGEMRLKYLRGNTAEEGSTFRSRSSVLGDIVHSTPVYIDEPAALYNIFPGALTAEESNKYANFRSTNADREPMIYIGANDGMLHAFDADTLNEKLAYVPSSVYDNLAKLTDTNYGHQYFVDGTPTVADVYYDNSWHTVLVGTTAAGGQGVFALDVTNPKPSNFAEANAKNLVLWEINPGLDADASDGEKKYADLGYTFSRPSVVRMNNGQWAAVFGNGYDSSAGKAVLYITDIKDGSLIRKFVLEDDTSDGTSNGLSTPRAVDVDGNHTVDRIYVGGLQGNLWAIDVSDSQESQWKTVFGTSSNPKPLFSGSAAQPITTRPTVVRHPQRGRIVLFGTGRFYAEGDATVTPSTPVQSLYGIWDSYRDTQPAETTRSQLVEQDIISATTTDGEIVRVLQNKSVDYNMQGANRVMGWYMDFDVNSQSKGEKIVYNPVLLPDGNLVFTTMIPSTQVCAGGGESWLMAIDPVTGARLSHSAFDVNDDGGFGDSDYVTIDVGGQTKTAPVSGINLHIGILPTPSVVITKGAKKAHLIFPVGEPVHMKLDDSARSGRKSWHQLQ